MVGMDENVEPPRRRRIEPSRAAAHPPEARAFGDAEERAEEVRSYLALGDPALQRVRIEGPLASTETGNDFREEFFDGSGRVWRRVRRGAASGQVIVEDSTYNVRGSITSTTAPYYGAGSPPYSATEAVYATTFAYDALDRRTSIQFPDSNQVTSAYGLLSETRTDEHQHDTATHYDVFGRKVKDQRLVSGGVQETQFTYDLLGRLTGMTDALGNAWSWTFDSLGRNRVKNDPDSGTWTLGYDDAGRLTTQTDAKNQRTDFNYDPAGRLSVKSTFNFAGVPEQTITFGYGEARTGYFNVGRATSTLGPGAISLTMDYDAAGRNVRQVRTLDSTSYNATSEYDAGGRLKVLRYSLGTTPGADTASYTYDAAGRIQAVAGYISSITYDAAGRPLVQTNENATRTNRTYSPGRGFLTYISTRRYTAFKSPIIQDLVYVPDSAGMLNSVTSVFDRESWTYGYDDAHRVTSATSPTPGISRTYQYDEIDRMTFNSRFGAYTYPPVLNPRPHAPTEIATRGTYLYDANGNLSSGGGLTLEWNVSNQPTLITSASTSTTVVYGGSGERVKKVHGTTTAIYPFGDDFEINGGIATRYISAPPIGVVAKVVGDETNPTPFWLHTDRLGSIQAVTDASGVEVLRRSYESYGDKIQDSSTHMESRGYIEQREDETGLLYLHARYYDPAIGVFTSPDPLHPGEERVGLNRFGYSGGDPVNGLDPSGLKWVNVCLSWETRYRDEGRSVTVEEHCSSWGQIWAGNPADGVDGIPQGDRRGGGGGRPTPTPTTPGPTEPDPTEPAIGNQPTFAVEVACPAAGGGGPSCPAQSGDLSPTAQAVVASVNQYNLQSNFFEAASLLVGLRGVGGYWKLGHEFRIGRNFRLALLGNRTGHQLGRWPHYHRRIVRPDGRTIPGGAIDRHRPWERPPDGVPWWRRF